MELNFSYSYNSQSKNFYIILLLFSIFSINSINLVSSNEVLGCGGFIKSHTDIDFSKIEIKLYTKQGSLKDKTDCSPSNGYYFLPVYDKGEYILQISPPSGWSFEPENVELNFNGKTDICTQGKDVNFIFKGFGITGKVYLAGQKDGIKDVTVELQTDKGIDLRKTVTDSNGVFSFTPIIPGKYLIKASHNRWYLSKSVYEVTVESGNTEIPENSLVVSGFDVEGKIGNNGQKFNSIIIGLFKDKIQTLSSNCNNKNMKKIVLPSSSLELIKRKSKYDENAICLARSDKNGIFVFNGVAPGKYILLPIVENADLKLNINPDILELNVERDIVILKDVFEIIGFSVSGKVLSSSKGNGISNAEIKFNDQSVAKTDENGNFMLENIKTGFYTIKVTSDYYKFNDQSIEISLNSPSISNIIASSYKVCGQVMSEDSHVIGITKNDKTFQINLSTDSETGEWCTFLPSGKYFVQVLATENDRANGVQQMFFPLKQTIDVYDSPISGILFSQLRVTLTGEVKCLPDSSSNCKNVEVTLQAIDSTGSLTSDTYVTSVKNGKYEFVNILPGPYEITVPQSNLCWETTKAFLNIMTVTETAPPFIHKGYEISIISSHRTKMQYTLRSSSRKSSSALPASATKTKVMNLMSGVNTFCVEYSGDYDIEFLGCHKYDPNNVPKKFSTDDKNPIIVTAIAHSVGIRILSTESNIDSFKMLIETKSNKEIINLKKDSKKIDGYNSYSYNLYLKSDDTVILKPQSNLMLFKPESKEITGSNDCIDNAFSFIAIKGLIINGKIVPKIKDVKITMNFPKNPDMLSLQTLSSANGEFKFGPIDKNLDYDLIAEKESYIFSEFDRSTNTFKANKLCDVIVTVKDEYNNKLSGVLLSLSGAESYRKNLITGIDGTIKFHSLSPSQYFLKPMMKEYKFNPGSKLIDVKNGETVHVELSGKRIAFSVFGTITSLNGDVFPNVIVEAIPDKNCGHHQEESSSEINGQYRIRGLQPGCTYIIRTKQDSNVERSIPPSRIVTINNDDVKNVNLIAISPVGVVDVIARVYASSIEHYKTLRIQMYRKGNADSPIYSQRIDTPLVKNTQINNYYLNPGIMVFFPRLPLDDKIYLIELKTTMSDKMYKYTLPIVQFVSNTSSIYIELNFQPEIKTSDSDLNQNSISALLLIILIGIVFFKQDLAINSFNFLWNHINNLIQEFIIKRENKKKNLNKYNEQINYKEIEQLAEGINAVKKKKSKKI